MALTAEQYEQLTQLLSTPKSHRRSSRAARAAYDGAEQREAPREPARGPAEMHVDPVDAGVPVGARPAQSLRTVTVYVHDVSPGGLGLLSGTPLNTGSAVRVVVTNGHDDVTVRCSVRHCTTLARGLYGVGVNVDDYDAPARTEPATDEAATAWSGFFSRQAAASEGLAG